MDIKKVLEIIAVNDVETDSVLTNLVHAYIQERDKSLDQYRKLEGLITSTTQLRTEMSTKVAELSKQVEDQRAHITREQCETNKALNELSVLRNEHRTLCEQLADAERRAEENHNLVVNYRDTVDRYRKNTESDER